MLVAHYEIRRMVGTTRRGRVDSCTDSQVWSSGRPYGLSWLSAPREYPLYSAEGIWQGQVLHQEEAIKTRRLIIILA